MNRLRLYEIIGMLDEELLERSESVNNKTNRHNWMQISAIAACLCILICGITWWQGRTVDESISNSVIQQNDSIQIPNNIEKVTKDKLLALGYYMPIPSAADNVECVIVSQKEGLVPMAEIFFLIGDNDYVFRALKSNNAQDISDTDDNYMGRRYSLETSDIIFQLFENSESGIAWISWYSKSAQTQWCLISGTVDADNLLKFAMKECIKPEMESEFEKFEKVINQYTN